MKWSVLVLALAIGGCASVADIKQTPPDLGGHFREKTAGICRLCGTQIVDYPPAAADRAA